MRLRKSVLGSSSAMAPRLACHSVILSGCSLRRLLGRRTVSAGSRFRSPVSSSCRRKAM